jgi:hypothetical protein
MKYWLIKLPFHASSNAAQAGGWVYVTGYTVKRHLGVIYGPPKEEFARNNSYVVKQKIDLTL